MKQNIMILCVIIVLMSGVCYAGSFVDDTSTEFNFGVYNWTAWKISDVLLSGELPDAGVNSAVDTTGLVGLWHLNGDANDTSGNSNDGTINGATGTTGKLDTALSFDGSDDYIDCGNYASLQVTNIFSVEAWIKPEQLADIGIVSRDDGTNRAWLLTYGDAGTNNRIRFGVFKNNVFKPVYGLEALTLNQWYHVVGVNDGTNLKIYLNGVLDNSAANGGIFDSDNANTKIGYYYNTNMFFNGTIDEVSIWNRALSSEEITAIYNAQKDNYPSSGDYESKIHNAGSSVAWENISWAEDVPYGEELPDNGAVETVSGGANMTGNVLLMHMDEATGTIYDTSGNANHGTASGGVTYEASGNFDKALSFDGVGSVDIGTPLGSTSSGTKAVSLWVKSIEATTGYLITNYDSNSHGFSLLFNSDRTMGIAWTGLVNAVQTTDTLPLNEWFHVVGIFETGTTGGKIYIDGTESVSGNLGTEQTTTNKVRISGRWVTANSGSTVVFNGSIDEVAIYNRALSPDEILDHYKRGALRLNISAKSCDDADCDGETIWDKTCTSSPCDISTFPNSQYMQYKIDMQSDSNSTPELSSVSVFYGTAIPPFTVGGTELIYRTPVNITENSGSSLTDYQVLLTIDTASLISAGKMQADCDDIRFTDSDETTELSYWIKSGCNTASTKVWVKVPSLSASSTRTLYMYYGNSTISSASDGRDTFIVWDDFDGGTEQWQEVDASGLITIDRTTNNRIDFALAGQTNERVYIDKGSDIGNFLMEYKFHITSDGRSNIILAGVSDTLSWGSTFNDAIHGDIYTQRAGNQNKWPLVIMSDGVVYRPGGQDEDYEGQDLYFRLTRYGNECKGYIYSDANRIILDASGNLSCTLTNLRYVYAVTNWYNDPGYITTMAGYVDDILVRKYTTTEPTYTIGSEQQNVAVPCTDNDGDGYGAEGTNLSQCTNPTVPDCNDTNADINPEAYDIVGNGIDEDCSGADASYNFSIETEFLYPSETSTYYVGDEIWYQITIRRDGVLYNPPGINLNLTNHYGTLYDSHTKSDMIHVSSGIYKGYFDSTNFDNNVPDIRYDVWIYGSMNELLDYNVHYDFTFPDGTAPSFVSTEYTYLTDAISNYTVKDLAVNSSLGKVDWTGTKLDLHARNIDLDSAITIGDRSAYLDSAAYSELNDSATITFYDVNCASAFVFYSETANTRTAILAENKQCLPPRCTDIQCSGSTLTVTVSSFTGYAAESDANLSIDADDPKFAGAEVHFTADYRNVTDDSLISGATCTIYFTDGNYPMAEGANIYTYNRTFVTEGLKDYNVTCSKAGFSTLTAFDNATIVSVEIPEFSIITLGLGLIIILIGLFIIRWKK